MREVRIDGKPAGVEDLTAVALTNYGAYTSMRVEDGAVRGLGLHLARLRDAAIELFGEAVDQDHLRALMRLAVGGRDACWLRVQFFAPQITPRRPDWTGTPSVMTVVGPAPAPLSGPLRLEVRHGAREAAHLKHVGTFGAVRARRDALQAGFDDALFVDADGRVTEGALWNIGFITGDRLVWPQGPMLAGVTQALISAGAGSVGLTVERRVVRVEDLSGFDAAFVCNSATPACAVAAVGELALPSRPDLMGRVELAWAASAAEAI